VTDVLARSGFSDIDVHPVSVARRLGAEPDEATAHLADTGVGRTVLATIPDDQHPADLDAVRGVLAEHLAADGVHLDGAILLTTTSDQQPRISSKTSLELRPTSTPTGSPASSSASPARSSPCVPPGTTNEDRPPMSSTWVDYPTRSRVPARSDSASPYRGSTRVT
jgi:hypothetical protein